MPAKLLPDIEIGARIREIRKGLGLTGKAFDRVLGGSGDAAKVSDWERGKHIPGTDKLLQIAELAGKGLETFQRSPRTPKLRVLDPSVMELAAELETPEAERARYARANTLCRTLMVMHDRGKGTLEELEGIAEAVMEGEEFTDFERDAVAEWFDVSRGSAGNAVSSREDRSRS